MDGTAASEQKASLKFSAARPLLTWGRPFLLSGPGIWQLRPAVQHQMTPAVISWVTGTPDPAGG